MNWWANRKTSKWKSRRKNRKDCLPKLKSLRSQEMQSLPTLRNALTICVWYTRVHMYVEVRDQHWVSSIAPHITFGNKITYSQVYPDGWTVSLRSSPISTSVLELWLHATVPNFPLTPPHLTPWKPWIQSQVLPLRRMCFIIWASPQPKVTSLNNVV